MEEVDTHSSIQCDWLVLPVGLKDDHENYYEALQASLATRPQVEQYLKGKGAQQVEKSWKIHGYYLTEQFKGEGYNLIPTHTIIVKHFDTAIEQIAEAILMAKLLNATKD